MGTHTPRIWLATALGIIVVACGAASTEPALESQSSQDQPRSFAESEQAAACETDADCPEGFACQELQFGEMVQRACVATSDASAADADAGRPSIIVDASVPTVDASHEPAPDSCTKALSVTVTEVLQNPRPKCYLDTTVDTTSPNATLYYACGDGGDDAALAKFGEQFFTGTVTSGAVSLQHLSSYTMTAPPPLNVTCRFDAKQLISGELASGTLQYTYAETMVLLSGPMSCERVFRTCSASGYVTVQ